MSFALLLGIFEAEVDNNIFELIFLSKMLLPGILQFFALMPLRRLLYLQRREVTIDILYIFLVLLPLIWPNSLLCPFISQDKI